MTNFRSLISRSLFTVAVLGLGLAVTASTARAAVITFGVEESVVTGANDTNPAGADVTANGLTAKYEEFLVLGAGTFDAFLVVEFSDYTLGGSTVTSQVAPSDGEDPLNPNLYGLYALVTVEGTFTQSSVDPDGIPANGDEITLTVFKPTDALVTIFTDPDRDTVTDYTTATATAGTGDDQGVLTASAIAPFPDSNGLVVQSSASGAVVSGAYALFFTDPMLLTGGTNIGDLYWPDLASLGLFFAIASGDVDPSSEGSIFPTDIKGDTSVSFLTAQAVPEPTSLVLLGTGLMGLVARRRRKA